MPKHLAEVVLVDPSQRIDRLAHGERFHHSRYMLVVSAAGKKHTTYPLTIGVYEGILPGSHYSVLALSDRPMYEGHRAESNGLYRLSIASSCGYVHSYVHKLCALIPICPYHKESL